MGTIYLDQDTLISDLMPSGGGALEAGDTIQLDGHPLIIDTDALDYPVTIANSAPDAKLELRDLGRIHLNATLPATVHPWVDSEHPLPVSAEPGIDGDPYRTNLTANARAEIRLAGAFPLGGGTASLPTETRSGGFWAIAVSYPATNQVEFDREINLHIGDAIIKLSSYNTLQTARVTAVSGVVCTLDATISQRLPGDLWGLLSGGVAIVCLGNSNPIINSPMSGGSINFLHGAGYNFVYNTAPIAAYRLGEGGRPGVTLNRLDNHFGFGRDAYSVKCAQSVIVSCVSDSNEVRLGFPFVGDYDLGDCALYRFMWAGRFIQHSFASPRFTGGRISSSLPPGYKPFGIGAEMANMELPTIFVPEKNSAYHYKNCTAPSGNTGNVFVEGDGTITLIDGAWYHAPATSSDVTWKYTDRTVPAGATLRLRCAWLREGAAATRASVAVTDPATWWPQLWPLGADALSSVDFAGGSGEWRSGLLTWRNTSAEAVQVRVWECVTGSTEGGYLQIEEIKGGPL